jgi:hypothetical protein
MAPARRDPARSEQPFRPRDIRKQVMVQEVAVAPDVSSIVYVRRTVEDGKYARRLWRTTFEGGAPEQLTSAKALAAALRSRRSFSLFLSDRSGRGSRGCCRLRRRAAPARRRPRRRDRGRLVPHGRTTPCWPCGEQRFITATPGAAH